MCAVTKASMQCTDPATKCICNSIISTHWAAIHGLYCSLHRHWTLYTANITLHTWYSTHLILYTLLRSHQFNALVNHLVTPQRQFIIESFYTSKTYFCPVDFVYSIMNITKCTFWLMGTVWEGPTSLKILDFFVSKVNIAVK